MKNIRRAIPILMAMLLLPALAHAAGGGGASELVVVADTRVLTVGYMRYFADLYNNNVVLFAVWATVLTAIYGAFLGFLMDFFMSRTGLDLSKRKIIEH
ncbi:DVU0150 family protein [Desulfocurvibacter africanus]|uniref:DVU0150 family protein n=1 Tax=Desulfocurvibacter africanus TaxID=873 RepID=UPI0003FE0737|nr:DVU0150 family protein [Desulfocurvibacter africanus]